MEGEYQDRGLLHRHQYAGGVPEYGPQYGTPYGPHQGLGYGAPQHASRDHHHGTELAAAAALGGYGLHEFQKHKHELENQHVYQQGGYVLPLEGQYHHGGVYPAPTGYQPGYQSYPGGLYPEAAVTHQAGGYPAGYGGVYPSGSAYPAAAYPGGADYHHHHHGERLLRNILPTEALHEGHHRDQYHHH